MAIGQAQGKHLRKDSECTIEGEGMTTAERLCNFKGAVVLKQLCSERLLSMKMVALTFRRGVAWLGDVVVVVL